MGVVEDFLCCPRVHANPFAFTEVRRRGFAEGSVNTGLFGYACGFAFNNSILEHLNIGSGNALPILIRITFLFIIGPRGGGFASHSSLDSGAMLGSRTLKVAEEAVDVSLHH